MSLPRLGYSVVLLGMLGSSLPAAAQVPQEIKPGDFATLVRAFKAICVDPGATAVDQVAAAQAEPWALPLQGGNAQAGDAFGRLYDGTPLQVTIKGSGASPNCTALTVLSRDTTLKAIEAASAVELGLKSGKVDDRRAQIDWPEALPGKRWVTFSLRNTPEMTVGIFAAFDPSVR
jgi:hypothetical protein